MGSGSARLLQAVIFDLDGLLINSEPLWHEAEVRVLGPLGVPVAQMRTRHTKGIAVEEVTRYWYERYPWSGPSTDEAAAQVQRTVEELVFERATLRPGALAALDDCRRRVQRTALASSSSHHYIRLALDRFDLAECFEVVRSAEDEPFGKPHPGVFLSATADLGVDPASCLVFEDSPAGVIAAKAAKMLCIAVPEPDEVQKPAIALADVVLLSLEELDETVWEKIATAIDAPR